MGWIWPNHSLFRGAHAAAPHSTEIIIIILIVIVITIARTFSEALMAKNIIIRLLLVILKIQILIYHS